MDHIFEEQKSDERKAERVEDTIIQKSHGNIVKIENKKELEDI